MNKAERHEEIISYMRGHNDTATIDELKTYFLVTNETIRKDFIEMEKQNLVHRVLGGAVLQKFMDERPISRRYTQRLNLKNEIAATAAQFICDRDFISLDSGTTNHCLASQLKNKNISVLTNSLDISRELIQCEHIRVYVAGGELRERNMSMTGEVTEKTIRNYRVQKCFLTSEGAALNYGIMDAHESESRVKKAMIEMADEIYLLVDHTKFSVVTPYIIAPLEKLTGIVTDSEVDREIAEEFKKAGIPLIIAEKIGGAGRSNE